MRHGERGRPEILRRMRGEACACLPRVRCGEHPGREVLRRLRGEARRAGAGGRAVPCAGGAQARLGALRGSGRLHDARRGPRPGGDARAPLALLRHGAPGHRPVRRHRREVHRRCGHGGLGRPSRAGGRRRASRACRARPRRGDRRPRHEDRSRRPRAPRRGRHRRGRYHDRGRRSGHGCGRHGQHRVAGPVRRGSPALRSSTSGRRA